jgi:hypothetical protein
MQQARNLVVAGIAGILLAGTIFSAFVIAPWSPLNAQLGSPSPPPDWRDWALSVRSFVSNLTEPLGVGSEGTLTVIVTSKRNASNVVVQFDILQMSDSFPLGITFIGEPLTNWSGDLRANVSMVFTARIKAVKPGLARLLVDALWYPPSAACGSGVREKLFILVQENDILVSHDPPPPILDLLS